MRKLWPVLLVCGSLCQCLWAHQDRAVFWESQPVAPGEVAIVLGAGLDTYTGGMPGAVPPPAMPLEAFASRFPDEPQDTTYAFTIFVDPPHLPRVPARVLQHNSDCVKLLVPSTFRPGVFLYEIEGNVLGLLNAPAVTWLQADQGHVASPGGWLRVFGTCLASDGGPTVLALARSENGRPVRGGPVITAQAENASSWSARFELPQDIPPGEYCLSVHSGVGGSHAWSWRNLRNTRAVRIQAPKPWPDEVFDVAQFGAEGAGQPTDEAAIRQALARAEQNGGGIVYFPRGRYMLAEPLQVPRYTVLRGQAREQVSLLWPETDQPPLQGQVVGTDHFALEDLTLYCSNYTHMIVSDLGRQSGGNVRLERIRVRANIFRGHLKQEQVAERFSLFMKQSTGGGDTVRLGGPNIVIKDCDLYGSGRSIWLRQADGALVQGNTIYQGRWGWYSFDGCDGLIFEGNTVTGADLMSTGGGINCLSGSYSRNVYYAGNTLKLMHGWDREAMTTDAGGGAYYGGIEECEGTTLVLNEPGDWSRGYEGAGVFILGGRGMGQYRRVVSYEGDRCEVNRPWIVEPDETSVITITMLHENYLFIGNRFEDAGIGLQYYGTTVNCIAAGNTATRAGGFYNSGRWYHGYQPSWRCQFLDNEILEGNCYRFGPDNATGAGLSFIGSWGLQYGQNTAPLALCSVLRRNRLHNNAKIDLRGVSSTHPGLSHVLVEGNRVADSMVGIYMDGGCKDVLLRGNRFENVTYERFDEEAIAALRRERLKPYIGRREPIAYWPLEADDSGRYPNATDARFAAVPQGDVAPVDGIKGKALRFGGESLLTAPGTEILNLESFTLSAWIRPEDIKGRWGIVAKRTGNIQSPFVFAISDGRIEFNATDNVGNWSYNFMSPPVVEAGRWQHVAVVMDQEQGITIYYGGKPAAQRDLPGERLCANDHRVSIGFEAWGGPSHDPGGAGHFVGAIDEVKLWGRALSAKEIASEYRSAGGVDGQD